MLCHRSGGARTLFGLVVTIARVVSYSPAEYEDFRDNRSCCGNNLGDRGHTNDSQMLSPLVLDFSSAQPPPLLRAFDDDWEAFRARGGYLAESPELANASLGAEIFPVSLPVNGNSAVLDRVGGCEVVLARRVGPGEVVKQLHLSPVSQRSGWTLLFVCSSAWLIACRPFLPWLLCWLYVQATASRKGAGVYSVLFVVDSIKTISFFMCISGR